MSLVGELENLETERRRANTPSDWFNLRSSNIRFSKTKNIGFLVSMRRPCPSHLRPQALEPFLPRATSSGSDGYYCASRSNGAWEIGELWRQLLRQGPKYPFASS